MKIDITTDRDTDGLGNLKDLHNVLVELKGERAAVLDKEGFQKFYQGMFKDESEHDHFLGTLNQRCDIDLKIVVASNDKTHTIRSGTADFNGSLLQELEKLEERYFIAPRNEWVPWAELHDFYTLNEETGYEPGTPVERLRQAAFDTRRTGTAWFNLGLLKGHQPDVEFLFEYRPEGELSEIQDFACQLNDLGTKLGKLGREVHKYEANDGVIKPKLTIKEADKAAKLFEQMADIVEPYWKRVEEDYNRGKEDDV